VARTVYTCSKGKELGCNFFLWEEDALSIEERSPSRRPHKKAQSSDRQVSPSPMRRAPAPKPPPSASSVKKTPTKSRNPSIFPSPSQTTPPSKRRRDEDDSLYDSDNEYDDTWRKAVVRDTGLLTPRKQRRTNGNPTPTKPPSKPRESELRGQWERRSTVITSDSDDDNDEDDMMLASTTSPIPKPTRRSLFTRPKTPPPPLPDCEPALADPRSRPQTPKKPNQGILGSPGRGVRDDLISDVFSLLTKGGVDLKDVRADLLDLLLRHLRQKEGMGQGYVILQSELLHLKGRDPQTWDFL
jgi:hypothetical protein